METINIRGLDISRFSLGTVQLGVNYGLANTIGVPSEEQAFALLNAAREVGVNCLDTANAYGTSEQVVGDWHKAIGGGMNIVSKFKVRDPADPIGQFKAQLALSQERLGTVAGYLFHDDKDLRAYGDVIRDEFLRAKEEGKTSFVGASVYTADDVEFMLEKHPWLEAVQLPMSVLDTRIVERGLLEELRKRNIIVFVRSVFLQGMLCMDKAPEQHSFMQPSLDAVKEVAKAGGLTMPQLAVAYIRDLPGVTSLVLGCEKAEQVVDNANLINTRPLTAAEMDAISEIGRKAPIERAMEVIRSAKWDPKTGKAK